jgi:hypothetical protein
MYIQLNEVEVVWEGKIKKVSLIEQVPDADEDIKKLAKYFIKNAFGKIVYVKAATRDLAQLAVDEYYGKNFYKVHSETGDSPKGDVTCRSVGTRRGQAQASLKSRILNS